MKRSTPQGKRVGSSKASASKTKRQLSPDRSDQSDLESSFENEQSRTQSSKSSSTPTPTTPSYSLRKRPQPQSGLQKSKNAKPSDVTSNSLFAKATVSIPDAKKTKTSGDEQDIESRIPSERRASRLAVAIARNNRSGRQNSLDPPATSSEKEQTRIRTSKSFSTKTSNRNPLTPFYSLRNRGQPQISPKDTQDAESSDAPSDSLFSMTRASKPDAKKTKTIGYKQDIESRIPSERRASRLAVAIARNNRSGRQNSSDPPVANSKNEPFSKSFSTPVLKRDSLAALSALGKRGQQQRDFQKDAKSSNAPSNSLFSIRTVLKPVAKKIKTNGDGQKIESRSRTMEHSVQKEVQYLQIQKEILSDNYDTFWEGTSLELFNDIPPASMIKLQKLFFHTLLDKPESQILRAQMRRRVRWDVTFPQDPNVAFFPDIQYVIDFLPHVLFKLDNSISVPHVSFLGSPSIPLPDCHLFLSIPPFSAY